MPPERIIVISLAVLGVTLIGAVSQLGPLLAFLAACPLGAGIAYIVVRGQN